MANVTGATLRPIIVRHISRQSILMSEESSVCTKVGTECRNHVTVNHSAGDNTRLCPLYLTNPGEHFLSIFKRGVIGVYHHLSEAHIGRYCAEFDFRHNTRKEDDVVRRDLYLKGIEATLLTYRRVGEAAYA